jgi:alkanesulfonate monooxygenase SsuD/methylene tetrahydromethanopterin reductase-like flavin-dependent oxidoreductase (luciferase family)
VGRLLRCHRHLGGAEGHEPAELDAEDRRERRAFPYPAGEADPRLSPGLEGGHQREPRVSVSRSIFALVGDRDRAYFGRGNESDDSIGYIDDSTRAIFGRSYAAEPDKLIDELKRDEAIAEADTLLLTVPNQLGVDYNAHVIEAILKHVAPGLGWR